MESKKIKDNIDILPPDSISNYFQEPLTDLGKILDFSMDLICSCDAEGRFVWVNKASERILGYQPEELIGEKYSDLIFQEDTDNRINEGFDFKDGSHVPIFEKKFMHKNGNIVYLQWSAVWDDVKKLCYCIGRDITEKKK